MTATIGTVPGMTSTWDQFNFAINVDGWSMWRDHELRKAKPASNVGNTWSNRSPCNHGKNQADINKNCGYVFELAAAHHKPNVETAGDNGLFKLRWNQGYGATKTPISESGIPAYDIDRKHMQVDNNQHGKNNGVQMKREYTHAYWIKWRDYQRDWRTLFRANSDHCVITYWGRTRLGFYSNRRSGWRDAGTDIKRDTWEFVVTSARAWGNNHWGGKNEYYVGGIKVKPTLKGKVDRVCTGRWHYRIGWGGQGGGKLAFASMWDRRLTANEIETVWAKTQYLVGGPVDLPADFKVPDLAYTQALADSNGKINTAFITLSPLEKLVEIQTTISIPYDVFANDRADSAKTAFTFKLTDAWGEATAVYTFTYTLLLPKAPVMESSGGGGATCKSSGYPRLGSACWNVGKCDLRTNGV
jgi:hypothetical protein